MVGAGRLGHRGGLRPLVRRTGIPASGEGQHRLTVQPRHQRQQNRAVDPARKEHPVRDVAALVQVDAFLERPIEPLQRGVLADVLGAGVGQRRQPVAAEHMPIGAGQRLPRQDPVDALEDGVRAGGELELQQLGPGGRPQTPRHEAGFEDRPRLRGEGQAAGDLGGVERLDAERVAGQRHAPAGAVVDRDREHAAQMAGVSASLLEPEMQRRLAVAVGREVAPAKPSRSSR